MRRLPLLLPLLALSLGLAADDLLGPEDYVKLMNDSKLMYTLSYQPAHDPLKPFTCERRGYLQRVVTKNGEKSLVPWPVKPEAQKLLAEAEVFYDAEKFDEAGKKYAAAIEADPQAVAAYAFTATRCSTVRRIQRPRSCSTRKRSRSIRPCR